MATQRTRRQTSNQATSVSNALIASELNEIGDIIELTGGDQFRARAYHNAARTISQISKDVAGMALRGEDLTQFPGIGESLAEKITEIARTGTCRVLEQSRHQVPPGLTEMLTVPGLGAHRVRQLSDELGIHSKRALADAARHGKLRRLKGFGETLEQKILHALELAPKGRRFKIAAVERQAQALLSYIQSLPGVKQSVIAGSYRRCKETVGDLDIVIEATRASGVIDRFLRFPDIAEKIAAGSTKASVVLSKGLQVDVRVVPGESFGAALYYFTGSKDHNIAVREIAAKSGLLLNEYGLFAGKNKIAGRSEKEVLRALGLDYVEPEMRENEGEIEAAATHKLPVLITAKDIRGDLHCHSLYSDGRHSIREMAEAARSLGMEYIAITDHSARGAAGLTDERFRQQIAEIDALNDQLDGITILKGAEVEILVDGSLELPDAVLKQFDIVVCSINTYHHLKREEQTERMLRALENPFCHVIAHPSGRLLLQRDAMELDMLPIMRKAHNKGVALEINGHPDRLDLAGAAARSAKEEGVLLMVTSDAHSIADFANMRLSIGQARRGWIAREDVINTRSLSAVRKLLRGGRHR